MRKVSIKPKKLYQLARGFIRSHPVPEKNADGGRPRAYSDALILTIACVQKLGGLSFRRALEYCEDFFPDLPSLSAYHERLAALPRELPKKFIAHLGT